MQRFVKTLNLRENPDSVREYIECHQNIPKDVVDGIRSVGITRMDLYLRDNTVVMVMECPDTIDVEQAMRSLASIPGQAEWENLVARFQDCSPDQTSDEKWKQMKKIFSLPPKKVFVSGCYDMLHSGHVAFFKSAARYGDLYVGIGSDKTIEELKHRKTVYSERERLYMVKAIRYVKDAFINSGSGMLDFVDTMDKVKPDVFVVNSDGGSDVKRKLCEERGIEYIVLDRIPDDGLEARSTTSLRQNHKSRIPYRVDIAGTWIDQPYVSEHGAGWALTVSIEPTVEFMERGGMSTSTRNAAKKVWPYELPEGDEEMIARLLFCFENHPENNGHISGAQDAIGICMSGLNRHFYDGHYWPSKIESCHDDEILDWLESHIALYPMFPRRPGCSVVEGKDVNPEKVKNLTEAADRCWNAIMEKNLSKFADAFKASFNAQVAMFPAMMQPGVAEHIDKWKDRALAWKMLGAGGGGHLALVFDEIPSDTSLIRIKIRRK